MFRLAAFLLAASVCTDLKSDLLALSGGLRVKMVWAKDSAIVCFDTDEGVIRRMLRPGSTHILAYPLITPDGNTAVYVTLSNKICKLDWNDSDKTHGTEICAGICPEASWRDPATGRMWVYYSQSWGTDNRHSNFRRFRLDAPRYDELVWNKTNGDVPFSLSADGRYGACQFPWPATGFAELNYRDDGSIIPNGTFFATNKNGCNSNILPDNSYRMFHVNLGNITWNDTTYANHHGIYIYDSLVFGHQAPYQFIKL